MAGSTSEQRWLRRVLHNETVGGAFMLGAAALALVLANSPAATTYHSITERHLNLPGGLNLSVAQWAADFLLALFFLVAGAELKHELTTGSLASARRAVVPVCGALFGMATSIPVFVLTANGLSAGPAATRGWAVPSSTDIAFALAVLAIGGRRMHPAVRVLLLSIAVVNDLGSILIIAVAFSQQVQLLALAGAAGCVALWGFAQRRGVRNPIVYIPLFLIGWWAMQTSGVHATVVGMAFGLVCSTRRNSGGESGADAVDRVLRSWVAGLAVPIFALTAAGVSLASESGGIHPLTLAVLAGLVVGQPVGVYTGMRIAVRLLGGTVADGLRQRDLLCVGCLAGVGFTVALLVSELTFSNRDLLEQAKLGVVSASVVAGLLSLLAMRIAQPARSPG